jgi:hypothetical protein
MKHYSAIKKEENMSFSGKQVGLEITTFSKVSQLRKTNILASMKNIDPPRVWHNFKKADIGVGGKIGRRDEERYE